MRGSRITLPVLLIACVAMSSLGNVVAAVPSASDVQSLLWNRKPIKIAISTSLTRSAPNIRVDSDVAGAIRRSLQKWSDVADVQFVQDVSDKQSVSPSGIAGDGVSLITIAQTPENVLFFSKDAESVSAKTRVFYNRRGFISEADIVLSPFQQFSTDGTFGTFDLESVLSHEIGHLLGLRHSNVLGATMLDGLGMNGVFGPVERGRHSLSESDISAVRELYGARTDVDDCCSHISGRLTAAGGRPAKNVRIWAEEAGTGRVAAQVDTFADGSYRLGGLTPGEYVLFWKAGDAAPRQTFGRIGSYDLVRDENRTVNWRITADRPGLALQHIGINGQLADLAVPLGPGRSYRVYLGGRNLRSKGVDITFSSPLLSVSRNSIVEHDYGDDISVISFDVVVDADIGPGDYSVFATNDKGESACLIGGVTIDTSEKAPAVLRPSEE